MAHSTPHAMHSSRTIVHASRFVRVIVECVLFEGIVPTIAHIRYANIRTRNVRNHIFLHNGTPARLSDECITTDIRHAIESFARVQLCTHTHTHTENSNSPRTMSDSTAANRCCRLRPAVQFRSVSRDRSGNRSADCPGDRIGRCDVRKN